MRYFYLIFTFLIFSCATDSGKKEKKDLPNKPDKVKISIEKITIPSLDSLPITADFYRVVNTKKPMILLCHQAGYSRGEYINTARELSRLGFTCLAIDQRSGNEANGVKNETFLRAKHKNLSTNYLDAKQDVEAAVNFLFNQSKKPIIIVGSSYSATLVLLVGNENSKIRAISAFSPGEYYPSLNIQKSIATIRKPIFVTSSERESEDVKKLVSLIDSKFVTQYIPNTEGIHGSRALWKSTKGNELYWKSFLAFLNKNSE